MKFWDSSAIVPLLMEEFKSEFVRKILEDDPAMVVWWATATECYSALCRKLRLQQISKPDFNLSSDLLDFLLKAWITVNPSENVMTQSKRLLRIHSLRAADAFQLAAALEFCSHRSTSLGFVSGDANLLAAAEAEGFKCFTV